MSCNDEKIVVIGFGHLMEYLFPCYQEYLGKELSTHLVATTVDAENIDAKRQKYPFQIIFSNNSQALATHPDIIFFAPPPQAAADLVEGTLVGYYEECRRNGTNLPDLYVFPPSPKGEYYLEQLGSDVSIVQILPNMTREIAGRNVAKEGYTLLTFPHGTTWEEWKKERLMRMFRPIGKTFELAPEHTLPVLASSVTCNVFIDLILELDLILCGQGKKVGYFRIAEGMRFRLNKKHATVVGTVLPCTDKGIEDGILKTAEIICRSWYEGLMKFLLEFGMEEEKTKEFLGQRLDSFLQMCQLMSVEQICEMREGRATRGGALYMGLQCYKEKKSGITEIMRKLIAGRKCEEDLRLIAEEIAQTVYRYSVKMGEGGRRTIEDEVITNEEFGIDHHATMYALLSKEIQLSCGEVGKKVMGAATLRYGIERGRRMAANAERNGDDLSLESYFAYVEWTDEKKEMGREIIQRAPFYETSVRRCGWVESWKKRGMLEYGRIYCQYADYGLVAGFNPKNILKLEKLLSFGSDYCDFEWTGYRMTEERMKQLSWTREKIGLKYRKDFLYHTAHLYQTIRDEFILKLGETGRKAAECALNEFGKIFSDEAAELVAEYQLEGEVSHE